MQGDFSINNTYDANGNRIVRETSFGNTVAYEFDALDQAVSIRINQDEPMQLGTGCGRQDRRMNVSVRSFLAASVTAPTAI